LSKPDMVQTVAAACALGVAVTLQGCGSGDGGGGGGGGDDPTPHSVTTTTAGTTSTTTTTTHVPIIPAMSGPDAALWFNKMYWGNNPDPESDVGVVIRMANKFEFFCDKPGFVSSCYLGQADCRVSGSLYNQHMSTSYQHGIQPAMNRMAGIVFNTSAVVRRQAKCAYQYDGASAGRYNHGCGAGAPNGKPSDCDEGQPSAYFNIDPATGSECKADADVVTRNWCQKVATKPIRDTDPQCFYKGVAFQGIGEPQSESEIKQMVEDRILGQKASRDLKTKFNEIVLDAEILWEDLNDQPALAVPAMMWVKDPYNPSHNTVARNFAIDMANEMALQYGLKTPVPVLAVDPTVDIDTYDGPSSGPFFVESDAFGAVEV